MADLGDLMVKLMAAIAQLRAAEESIAAVVNDIQMLIVTEAEADTITIDDPEG